MLILCLAGIPSCSKVSVAVFDLQEVVCVSYYECRHLQRPVQGHFKTISYPHSNLDMEKKL